MATTLAGVDGYAGHIAALCTRVPWWKSHDETGLCWDVDPISRVVNIDPWPFSGSKCLNHRRPQKRREHRGWWDGTLGTNWWWPAVTQRDLGSAEVITKAQVEATSRRGDRRGRLGSRSDVDSCDLEEFLWGVWVMRCLSSVFFFMRYWLFGEFDGSGCGLADILSECRNQDDLHLGMVAAMLSYLSIAGSQALVTGWCIPWQVYK